MALTLPDKWIWDFWLATDDAGEHHVFYLQAPRSLGDPDLRHRNATIGHAVSSDLRDWQVLPDALRPGEPGSWDDVATWTGSIIRHDAMWHMFYTGTSHREGGRVQRVGLATSDDLITWHKHDHRPLIEADRRWYETAGTSPWPEEAWRDPWVFEADGTFHALITARCNQGPSDGRGVIGHACSTDLLDWEVQPPLSQPGEFGHLEVPQLANLGSEHFLVFSCDKERVSAARRTRLGEPRDAVYMVPTSNPLGPYEIRDAWQSLPSGLYSGKVLERPDHTPAWLAFVDHGPDGAFVGALSDPIPHPWRET